MGEPAKGSWPPFQPGHELNTTHGAQSPTKVQPIAEALAAEYRQTAAWIATPAFNAAVASWSWSEAQVTLLRSYLDEHGMLDNEGQPRPAAALLGKVESRLLRLRASLGLTPQALGSLLDKAARVAMATGDPDALAAARAEGRRLLAAHGELSPTTDETQENQP